jgi:23S rRNA (cytidine1920-2'-O)/16S rRNA (cytidine1409-2'-O)-methyltransferase
VTADGRTVEKPSELLADDAAIAATAAHPWVGRGALKLVQALDAWDMDIAGAVVLDIGASTGGFTEVCLSRGARRVYAVDVGRGQLHPKLAADSRVVNLEATDARDLTRALIPEPPDLVVADVSFVSLTKVMEPALQLAANGAQLAALVKPQFEAGRSKVGKGGIVTDREAQLGAVAAVRAFIEALGWRCDEPLDSPIAGGDGNREFLLRARRR